MRIQIIVSDFPKVTETFVLANALHFLNAGHDVGIFHLKPFRHNEVIHDTAQPAIDRGFTFGWLDKASLSGLFWALTRRPTTFFPLLIRLIARFFREPKRLVAILAIVPKSCALARRLSKDGTGHIHAEFAGYPATSAWIASLLSGVPYSFSAHAHDIFLTQTFLPEKAQEARFVRVISRFNQDFLNALPGFPETKTEVLRCGVALTAPTEPNTPNSPVRMLFVGALLPRKGVDDLLAALADLRDLDIHLDIVGGGRLLTQLRDMADQMGLNVTFHGPQPSSVVRDKMRAAHLVVVPSKEGEGGRSEGIPVVLMEAMSEARPVIASRLSGIPELVEDGQTGRLCTPNDPASLASAIRTALNDWPATVTMAKAGRARVEADYDISKNAAALLDRITQEAA